MNKKLLFLLFLIVFSFSNNAKATDLKEKPTPVPYSLTVFNEILFYDGYAGVVNFPTPEGVIRHRNDLYATKLTEVQLASFGGTLTMNITIKAACDNYDRIGNVNLAFVPKGATTYVPNDVDRIEIGRFITPFMNKNIAPTQVPYTFSIDNVVKIFKNEAILAEFDIWAELQVFGVPYAANTQVAGCAGRNDVFFGTLEFVSDTDVPVNADNLFLLPLSFQLYMNNYQESGTDEIGETYKYFTVNLDEPIENAVFHWVTSNHGANAGGEEYNRRLHLIYFDDEEQYSYVPGSLTCEPFRVYNTQPNGIYGTSPRTPAQWQSFSNWCPGDIIPNRSISMGTIPAGEHTFLIYVPNAVFVDAQGYIPFSLYLQGEMNTTMNTADFNQVSVSMFPNPSDSVLHIHSNETINEVVLTNLLGQEIFRTKENSKISVQDFNAGIYLALIHLENGQIIKKKFIKK